MGEELEMKRGNYAQAKLKSQWGDFARETHYARVEGNAKEAIKNDKRNKRLAIIIKKGIKKDKEFELSNGIKLFVRFIKLDGIIVLDNRDEIDPLNLD